MAAKAKEQVMMAEPLVLDVAALAPFEIGARLDALLCYSTWSPARQQTVADAICADMMAHWVELEPSRRAELYELRPQYRKARNRASLEGLLHRREEVLTAGLAFLPPLKAASSGAMPEQERKLSLSEIARYIWPPRAGDADWNYESRIHDKQKFLRGLRPIAHLAAAYQFEARERSGNERAASMDYQDLGFHREVVRRANEYGGYFAASPAWANIASVVIPIVWRE